MKIAFLFLMLTVFSGGLICQTEVLTNSKIVEMTDAGLATGIVLLKIRSSTANFDISSDALIALKKAGVKDDVIAGIVEKGRSTVAPSTLPSNATPGEVPRSDQRSSGKDALLNARTISFQKSSLQPSMQALEKELLKRADWRALNLTIEQYKDTADLYVEIGFVHMSVLTHRYVFRIYDRRSGVVIAAGETTSWGSLAKNLARNISRSLQTLKT